MFEPFLQFFTLLMCSFFRVSKDAWDLDHRIDFNNGKVIDSGNYWTRKTLESWHTAVITNSDNNSNEAASKTTCYACSQNI